MKQTNKKTDLTQDDEFSILAPGFDFFPDSIQEEKPLVQVKKDVEEVNVPKGSIQELAPGTTLEIHRAANLLPMQTREDYERMREGISHIGQTDPIELLNGRILDGRNRYKACLELGIPINAIDLDIPEEKAEAYVYSRNLHRRQLSKGQLAVMALVFLPEEQKKSRERQLDALKQTLVRQKNCLTKNGDVATILGKRVRVNKEYIKYAIAVHKKKPELLEKVFNGDMEITEAYREARRPAVPVEKKVYLPPEQVLEIILDRLQEEDNDYLIELSEQTNGKIKQALLKRTRRESDRLLDEKIDEIGGVE